MALVFIGNPLTGTANADFIIDSANNSPNNTLSGLGGNDLLLADFDFFFSSQGGEFGLTALTAFDITGNLSPWSTAENSEIVNSTTIPHTSILFSGENGGVAFYSVVAVAGAQITLDIDFGLGPGGDDTDTVVEIYAADGTTLLAHNDDNVGDDVGSVSTIDSFLQHTFAAAGTYIIKVKELGGDPFVAGDDFILNVSLTGQSVTNDEPVSGNDTLIGGEGIDFMSGQGGNDVFLIASPSDHPDIEMINGGGGTDRIRFTSTIATETLILSSLVTLVEIVEITDAAGDATGTTALNLDASALTSGVELRGNAGANTITGTGLDDTIDALGGEDVVVAGNGDDTITDTAGIAFATENDVYDGGDGIDTLVHVNTWVNTIHFDLSAGFTTINGANRDQLIDIENLTVGGAVRVTGDAEANVITVMDVGPNPANTIAGGGGDDTVNAGGGVDTLNGDAGNDIFLITSEADHPASETINGGADTDRIRFTSIIGGQTLTLSNQVTLVEIAEITNAAGLATGTTALNLNAAAVTTGMTLNGNAGANTITGTGLADTINGNGGADTLFGEGGDDTYVLGAGGASIVEDFDRGSDTITSTVSRSLELEANIENLTLLAGIIGTGNTFANIIVGNAGANTLDGLTDRDDLRGGDGSDTYFADVANEIIKETNTSIATGGNDLVRYSGATGTFVLADNVERLTLTHVAASTNGTGNGLGNTIIGNGGANILNGLDGADSLNGGAGRDDLRGGAGSDTYFADVANEIIRETNTSLATGGNDLVNFSGATGTFTLSANVERLTLTHATANTGGIGNGLVNTIIGNAGKNILDGKGLKDILRGFNGSDTYIVDASRDTVIEASGNAAGRADLVKFTGTAAQTYALTVNVENLTLTGNSTTRGTGNVLANTITGNNAANVLSGGSGNDTLAGMGGHDALKGGTGRDAFAFRSAPSAASSDRILDFHVVDDIIKLENTIFRAIVGSLDRTEFVRNTTGNAVDGNDFLIYETDTGELYYDRNGNAAGGSVLIATLGKNLALTAADFGMI